MEIDIRRHIINNFKEDDINTLRNAIEESIKDQDEVALPGMGVFLEVIWQDSSEELKKQMLDILYKRVKKQ